MTSFEPGQPPPSFMECPQCGQTVQLLYMSKAGGYIWPCHLVEPPTSLLDFNRICPMGRDAVQMAAAIAQGQQDEQ